MTTNTAYVTLGSFDLAVGAAEAIITEAGFVAHRDALCDAARIVYAMLDGATVAAVHYHRNAEDGLTVEVLDNDPRYKTGRGPIYEARFAGETPAHLVSDFLRSAVSGQVFKAAR